MKVARLSVDELVSFAKQLGCEIREEGSGFKYRDTRLTSRARFRWVEEFGDDPNALRELLRFTETEGDAWTLEYVTEQKCFLMNIGMGAQGLGPTPAAAIVRAMLDYQRRYGA